MTFDLLVARLLMASKRERVRVLAEHRRHVRARTTPIPVTSRVCRSPCAASRVGRRVGDTRRSSTYEGGFGERSRWVAETPRVLFSFQPSAPIRFSLCLYVSFPLHSLSLSSHV
jgi:hypothetical protein